MATFITAWSRTIRNWAAASTAITPHLAMAGSLSAQASSAFSLPLSIAARSAAKSSSF
jgi:hypothetical protein